MISENEIKRIAEEEPDKLVAMARDLAQDPESGYVLALVAESLFLVGVELAEDILIDLLSHPRDYIREAALASIGLLGISSDDLWDAVNWAAMYDSSDTIQSIARDILL